ncbi:MAG: short-chain dehydrogenase [Gammaproteobacteria bacterium]|jgi:NAD(P)-dependent dehydrogenase (short-subunit alcohol dehydrogenase family)|nr:short-chain dehydrogenase [Gammaproteobacteria bacterium]HJO11982.1 SDR family oxidoreductase [Gammaproteobacteria bacterium]
MATYLVTGTNRGIGLEFVEQLIQRGDEILATCRNIDTALELKQLHITYADLHLLELDLSQPESLHNFANQLKGAAIDVFINNAGVYGPKNVEFGTVNRRVWAQVFQVNTIAPLLLTQALEDNFKRGNDKKLVYISSKVGSIDDNRGGGGYIYRSSKTALNQVVKSLSIDLYEDGFIATALHPGWVLTEMGGPNALISPSTSVSGMLQVIDGLTLEQSGCFINYDGTEIPW